MPNDFKMAVLPVVVLIILAFLAVSLYFSHNIGSQNEHIVIQRLCMYIYTGSILLFIYEHFHILMFIQGVQTLSVISNLLILPIQSWSIYDSLGSN